MGFMTGLKAAWSYRLQQKGQQDEALKLYEEAFSEGLDDPRYNLAYALMITRRGEYQKAKEFLVKHQKAPGMTQDQRVTLLVDYAACCFRLGDNDKGINTGSTLWANKNSMGTDKLNVVIDGVDVY